MKLRFESDLEFQKQAIDAVCDLFRGQEINRTEFTVSRVSADAAQAQLGLDDDGLGVGNRLTLLPDEILANLRDVQLRHALAPAETLESMDFTVEMETGTGKTYVYLRTIFKLNRLYGFTKFVIVVPSVAIREGVAKTLEMTRDHFRALYAGQPMDSFVYDSAKLGQVRDFATSSTIKVMIATIGSLNKLDTNVFYTPHERTGGERPVDLVRATRPVIIVDEPQSVDGGATGKGKQALDEMRPLCTLRYSATHATKHHMVYRLDAVDAYEQKLVKRIDVAGLEITGAHNTPYVRVTDIKFSKSKAPVVSVEIDMQGQGTVLRQIKTGLTDGRDLADLTKREVYRDISIGTIERSASGEALMQLNLPGDVKWLRVGEAHGDVDRGSIVRRMIQRTIKEHFDREKVLRPLGIKVLSLFFIDRVDQYRVYGEDGSRALGPYGVMFEEEYRKLAAHPDYRASLFGEGPIEPERAHDGYFSIDKKVVSPFAEHELKKTATAEAVATDSFNLIMKQKERLLDEKEPLRFIFSHSALREGWDNPNVFQICVLREMGGDRERRQTIGRGLRLCVDSKGERRRDEGLNVLTVIAEESYASFAEGLQNQIETDLGIHFGTVTKDAFAHLPVEDDNGVLAPLGVAASTALFDHLQAQGYLNARGKIEDSLRRELKAGTLKLPEAFNAVAGHARALLTKLAGRLDVRNADNRVRIGLNREVFLGEEFRSLWERISARTTYRVAFDNEALIVSAAERLKASIQVAPAQARWRKGEMEISKGGVSGVRETTSQFMTLSAENAAVPDVLGELQNRTELTRRTLARVLIDSGRLDDLRQNPASFIDQAADLINRAKVEALVDGIRYQAIGPDAVYAQELFETEELNGYLDKMVEVQKSVSDAIRYDSTVERTFAETLNANEAVKVFAKLPDWFKVPTPLGPYNPDWAVLLTGEAGDRLYFVVETKGSQFLEDLRAAEAAKIECGAEHFREIGRSEREPAFMQAVTAEDVLKRASA